MGMTGANVAAAVSRAKERMAELEQELNLADARLGDGDTGGMLRRVVDRMGEQEIDPAGDVGAAFGTLARAAASATGSSLGTLLATGLLTLSKATRGRTEVAWEELGTLLGQARDTVMARGGAKPGDKTVVDALDAVAAAVSGLNDGRALGEAAAAAAQEALDRFRDRPCRMGRARMFAEKSVGNDDPGMLAFARLVAAMKG